MEHYASNAADCYTQPVRGPCHQDVSVQVRDPLKGAWAYEFNDDKCILCGNCARRCPAAAIEINKEKNELVFYPARCIICFVCVEACNKDAVIASNKWRTPYYTKPVEVHVAKGKKEKAKKE